MACITCCTMHGGSWGVAACHLSMPSMLPYAERRGQNALDTANCMTPPTCSCSRAANITATRRMHAASEQALKDLAQLCLWFDFWREAYAAGGAPAKRGSMRTVLCCQLLACKSARVAAALCVAPLLMAPPCCYASPPLAGVGPAVLRDLLLEGPLGVCPPARHAARWLQGVSHYLTQHPE